MSDTTSNRGDKNLELVKSEPDDVYAKYSNIVRRANELLPLDINGWYGFNADRIKDKIVEQIGKTGCLELCILAATLGTNIKKYGNRKIRCRGKISGDRTIYQLVKENIVAMPGTEKKDWNLPGNPVPINQICNAASYIPLLHIRSLKKRGEDISMFQKNIKTSLPIELQFTQAATLPLPEKLRAAHIAFTAKFFKSIGNSFILSSYLSQISYGPQFEKRENIMAILKELEENIVLNDDEVGMTEEKAAQM